MVAILRVDDSEESLHGGQKEVDSSYKYRLVKSRAQSRLDYPVSEADNDDEDPGNGSLCTAYYLGAQDQTLSCL